MATNMVTRVARHRIVLIKGRNVTTSVSSCLGRTRDSMLRVLGVSYGAAGVVKTVATFNQNSERRCQTHIVCSARIGHFDTNISVVEGTQHTGAARCTLKGVSFVR